VVYVCVCVAQGKNRTIKHLDLRDNKIQVLPYGFVHLGLKSLELKGNESLQFPPKEVAEVGSTDILIYFHILQEEQSVKVMDTKLILLGRDGIIELKQRQHAINKFTWTPSE